MSKHITVNGKIYEPSAALARRFGYSLDYVSRLAREGKIDSTRVGRQWFAEASSLKQFVDETNLKKDRARAQLREERKREQLAQTESTTILKSQLNEKTKRVIPAASVDTKPQGFGVATKRYFDIATAIAGAVLVLTAGLMLGVAINPGDFNSLVQSTIDRPYRELSRDLSKAGAFGARTSDVSSSVPAGKNETSEATARGGIVVMDGDESAEKIDKVRSAFSDEVDVQFNSDDSGVITPVFREGRGDDYQFLMVPVRDSS